MAHLFVVRYKMPPGDMSDQTRAYYEENLVGKFVKRGGHVTADLSEALVTSSKRGRWDSTERYELVPCEVILRG